MAEISASDVMKLRKMSGQGMMDCKKALIEAEGDIDNAMGILRKKGLATLAKRAGRDTSEGRIVCRQKDGDKTAAMVSLCCETDFVANSDDFSAAAEVLGDYALACEGEQGAEAILATAIDGKAFSDVLTEAVSKTGEKMEVGDYSRFTLGGPGVLGSYVHFNGKVGALVEVEASDDSVSADEQFKRTADEIAMHITAIKPLALDRDGLDAETVEREKAIAADQVKNKPAEIIDKIVEGKMNKFFAENCLVAQPFVKDDSKKVEEVLAEAAKKCGGTAKIKRFVRFEIS